MRIGMIPNYIDVVRWANEDHMKIPTVKEYCKTYGTDYDLVMKDLKRRN
jgi:hypothetical protein